MHVDREEVADISKSQQLIKGTSKQEFCMGRHKNQTTRQTQAAIHAATMESHSIFLDPMSRPKAYSDAYPASGEGKAIRDLKHAGLCNQEAIRHLAHPLAQFSSSNRQCEAHNAWSHSPCIDASPMPGVHQRQICVPPSVPKVEAFGRKHQG